MMHISYNNNLTNNEARQIINIFTKKIVDVLDEQKNILLLNFGKFYVTQVPEKMGKNPKTGETIKVKAYKQPRFKASKKLRKACNSSK